MSPGIPSIGTSIVIASELLLTYDYLCTLATEAANIWTRPLSFVTFIFYINRYLPFVDTSILLGLHMSIPTLQVCESFTRVYTWLLVVGSILSHVVIMVRTCALWGYHRRILILIGMLALFEFTTALVATYFHMRSLKLVATPAGCLVRQAGKIIVVAYIVIFIIEAIVVILTLVMAYRHLSASQASWVRHLYQNGILFCVMMLVVSLVNIILPLTTPPMYKNLFSTPQRVLHSIICNRVFLLVFKHREELEDRKAVGAVAANIWLSRTNHTTINTDLSHFLFTQTMHIDQVIEVSH